MSIKLKNISESLENLAKLVNIDMVHGWRSRLAEWIGASLSMTSKWIERNSIPDTWLAKIDKKGYPPAKWLVDLDWVNVRLSDKRPDLQHWSAINSRVFQLIENDNISPLDLYQIIGITPKNYTRHYPLGEDFSIFSPNFVNLMDEKLSYNRDWIWFGKGNAKKTIPPMLCTQPNETILLSKHQITQTFELDNELYVNMVRDILNSGQTGTVLALKSNIHAFHEQVRDKAHIGNMEERIKALDKEVTRLKNITGGCAEPAAQSPESAEIE